MVSLGRFLFVTFFLLASATTNDPRNFPGFADLEICAKEGLVGCPALNMSCSVVSLPSQLGCTNWVCVCDNLPSAVIQASSDVASACTSNSVQISSATSLLNGFCEQLPTSATRHVSASTTGSTGRPH